MTRSHVYRWEELHIESPWIYLIVFSLLCSVFCIALSHILFAISLYVKKNGLWIFVIAGAVSLMFFYAQYMLGYDVLADVVVHPYEQSGIPTLIIWISMILIGNILIARKLKRWEHEE